MDIEPLTEARSAFRDKLKYAMRAGELRSTAFSISMYIGENLYLRLNRGLELGNSGWRFELYETQPMHRIHLSRPLHRLDNALDHAARYIAEYVFPSVRKRTDEEADDEH